MENERINETNDNETANLESAENMNLHGKLTSPYVNNQETPDEDKQEPLEQINAEKLPTENKKTKKNKKKTIILTSIFVIIAITIIGIVSYVMDLTRETYEDGYITSVQGKATLFDLSYNEATKITRGMKVKVSTKKYTNAGAEYKKILYKKTNYYVEASSIVYSNSSILKEKKLYVRTPSVIYFKENEPDILKSTKKGEEYEILGYDQMKENGTPNMYKVKVGDKEGYIYSKYVTLTGLSANENYNENGKYDIHKTRGNTTGGGSAVYLDYFGEKKPKFKNNKMLEEHKSIYLSINSLSKIDEYITLAKNTGINTFVIDIKTRNQNAYTTDLLADLSPSSKNKAVYTADDFKKIVKKVKDKKIYVVGRITAFDDSGYAVDNKIDSIVDKRNGKVFNINEDYYSSPYSRKVWEYNVKVALEAVDKFKFNEIMFDNVKFPDGIIDLENAGHLDMKNTYNEEKSQAIQQFLTYAKDELHKKEVYLSVNVDKEAAYPLVTVGGQYWPAISNVVDVISSKPFPDTFAAHEFSIPEYVWQVPYKIVNIWSKNVIDRQMETTTAAKTRMFVAGYDVMKVPAVTYDETKVTEQIKGIYDTRLIDGYILYNSSSSFQKYKDLSSVFKKELRNG
jgi:Uncharacterized conserved protein